MKTTLPIVFVAIAAMPASVLAEDLGNGLSVSGSVKLEYVDAEGGNSTAAFDTDVSLSWRSSGMLGFDAALDSIYVDQSGTDLFTNAWASLVLVTGVGEFSIGAPRPVVETMRPLPRFSTSRLVDAGSEFHRGNLGIMLGAADGTIAPGLAFKGTSGTLSYGFSFNRYDIGSSDADLFQGVMRYDSGALSLYIAAQIAQAADDATSMAIGGIYDADRMTFGAELTKIDGTSSDKTTMRLLAGYDITPAMSVTADYLAIDGSTDDLLSLSGHYDLGNVLFIEGGATFDSDSETYDIGIGLEF